MASGHPRQKPCHVHPDGCEGTHGGLVNTSEEPEWEDDGYYPMPPKSRFRVLLNIVSVRRGRPS